MSLALALDRSVRTTSIDGHLHVASSHISKATVNPYKGSEIPDWERLGLKPDQIYNLFRDPDELARAAPTFNNIPLLSRHVPVSSEAPQHELIMGSTGTDCVFMEPYLDNSLVIWDGGAIAGIDTGQQRELSCAYRYVADMTPGTHKGLRYDGIMRNIVGNHVALVEAGRAGSDVIVGDAAPELSFMSKPLASRKAILVRGCLTAVARPLLAQDAKVDFGKLVADVTAKNFGDKKVGILAALKPKLAADAKIETVKLALDDMDDETDGAEDEDDLDKSKGEEGGEEGASDEEEDLTDEEKAKAAKAAAKDKAKDAEPDMKAMDAAIAKGVKAIAVKIAADAKALREAERAVRPYVGEVAAMDSAEEVYRFALDSLGVKLGVDVHPSALPVILANLPKATAPKPRLAQDAAAARDTVTDLFPNIGRIAAA